MFTRRNFLKTASVAAGASLTAGAAISAETTPKALPPSLAQLQSLRDQAKPITVDERRQRLERARRLLRDNRLDALMLMGGTSLVYFTGVGWWMSERLFAVIVPAAGDAFAVSPAFEEARAREQMSRGPLGDKVEVLTWQEDESPYERIAQGLRDRKIAGGTLGIEETTRFVFSDGLAKAAPALTMTSATAVTAGCRAVKSPQELALMRLACRVTLTAYAAAYHALKEGMTQNDFEHLVVAAHERLGFEGDAGVQVGQYSALPHGSIEPQVVREGTILLMDGGCSVEGYQSDISRTFVLGKPTDKMKKVFDIVHRAQQAAVSTARPGLACGEVDAAARKVISDAGFGPDYKHFTHRVGHGIGMDGHEWPYLVRNNKWPLEKNMTFSDEPGIYIPGEFGVRLEDDMVITTNGAELLTPPSPSLEDPFGNMESLLSSPGARP